MFVVRCPALLFRFFAALRKTFLVTIDEADLCHPEQKRSCVTIDGAAGDVKDLEYHIGPPHWQPSVIPKEICTPMMPLKAYIDG